MFTTKQLWIKCINLQTSLWDTKNYLILKMIFFHFFPICWPIVSSKVLAQLSLQLILTNHIRESFSTLKETRDARLPWACLFLNTSGRSSRADRWCWAFHNLLVILAGVLDWCVGRLGVPVPLGTLGRGGPTLPTHRAASNRVIV